MSDIYLSYTYILTFLQVPDAGIHRYRHNITIYRYRRTPDIGYTRYRVYADIGYTRHRVYTDIGIISQYTDIGVHPTSCHLCIRYRVIECSDVVNIEPVIGPGPGAGFPAAAACSDSLGEA
jgi:hypothetical protein